MLDAFKIVVIVTGIQGSGKSTLFEFLKQQNYKVKADFFNTGERLRALNNEMNTWLSQGNMANDEVTNTIFKDYVCKNAAQFLVVDGYPRNNSQVSCFIESVSIKAKVVLIQLELPEDNTIKRLQNRKRNDDTTEAIKKRLETYHQVTLPAIYRLIEEINCSFLNIDASQPIENIQKQVLTYLQEELPFF